MTALHTDDTGRGAGTWTVLHGRVVIVLLGGRTAEVEVAVQGVAEATAGRGQDRAGVVLGEVGHRQAEVQAVRVLLSRQEEVEADQGGGLVLAHPADTEAEVEAAV